MYLKWKDAFSIYTLTIMKRVKVICVTLYSHEGSEVEFSAG